MLRWPYIWRPQLDCSHFLIYCSSHTPLLPDQRDLKAHNSFDRNYHRKFPRKQKEIHLQGSFSRWLISLFSIIGLCLFLDMWCAKMLPPFWTVEIGNTHYGKVSFILNSSLSIFRLAWFYLDIGRSNHWIILILRYIVHKSRLYILIVGFKNKI
jgi:hypothetical protein